MANSLGKFPRRGYTQAFAIEARATRSGGGWFMRVLFTLGLLATLATGVMAQTAAELKVGDMAPDFTLQGTDGKTHKLSDFRGKQAVVVAWFPRAFTQGCTIECKSMAENGERGPPLHHPPLLSNTDTP